MRRAQTAAVAALLALAACSESGGGITRPDTPASPPPPNEVAQIPCTADVRAGTLSCSASAAQTGAGIRGNRVIGGQRTNVTLTSSNVVYDSVAQVLSADVTVQNLLLQRMGSDGSTVSGVKVFFATLPTVTAGSGQVTVANADGEGLFTASGQPYFDYPGGLAPNATSAPERWEFNVPKSATTFIFSVYVYTPLVPVIVFEMAPGGNRDVYRMGIDGNDLAKLTTSTARDANPTVAGDKVVFVSYRDGNAELYSVPLRGGTETRLTTTPTLAEATPALSPDGARLAWSRPASGVNKLMYGKADATGGLPVVSLTGDAIESTPAWADSMTLAFGSTSGGSSDIYKLTVGGTQTLLAGGDMADVEPAWNADGTRVAFASNRSGDTELYYVTVGTGVVTRVTTRTGSDGAPSWLKDGRIVYTCVQGSTLRLCIVDPANPAGASLITTPNAADHAIAVRF